MMHDFSKQFTGDFASPSVPGGLNKNVTCFINSAVPPQRRCCCETIMALRFDVLAWGLTVFLFKNPSVVPVVRKKLLPVESRG
jgi:hypothetical protein